MESPEQWCRVNDRMTGRIRRLSLCQNLAKKLEKDRTRILGEQLNDALKNEDAREACRLSRTLPGRGMGARRRHVARDTCSETIRCSWVRAKTSEQPIDQGGCNGLRIIFSNEVESMKEQYVPIVVNQNSMVQGHRDLNIRSASVWKLKHWRSSVTWSIPAEHLKILVFFQRRITKSRTSTELETKENAKDVQPIIKHFFVSLFAVVHVAEYAALSWHRAQGAFIPKGAKAERCIMVMCSLGKSWYRGLGVTSALRLHDATNAFLSMKHDVVKHAANEMELKEVDKELFDQHISLAVVTISDEEGEIDILAISGM